jgi:hypothetical protein
MLVALFLVNAGLAIGASEPLTAAALLEQANAQFHQGVAARAQPDVARKHFAAARAAYETLPGQGYSSAALFRNQGNAALLAGDLPGAILAYRQALQLDPGDRTLQESLEYARDQAEYPRSDVRAAPEGWPSFLPLPSDTVLLALAIGFYMLACMALTRWLMIRRLTLLVSGGLGLILACAVGAVWGTRQASIIQLMEHPLVVVRETTPLRIGNGVSYPAHHGLPSARRGMEGQLQFTRGDWLQVEFPGGVLGWLPRERVLLDTTSH